MRAYKLVRQRKDGSLAPLFINRRLTYKVGGWHEAEDHPTKGFAHRPGFHCCRDRHAPHLKMEGRVWIEVEIKHYKEHKRPANQGGTWLIAQKMKVIRILKEV